MFEEYTFVFDIDGTICPVKKKDEEYADMVPDAEIVEKMRYYKENGARIILYTSRNMNTFRGDLSKIHRVTAPILRDWLKKWDIPYDEIVYGKVWPGHKGFYVDDRTVRPGEFLTMTPEEMEARLASVRCVEDEDGRSVTGKEC